MFEEWNPFDEIERLQRRVNAIIRKMPESMRKPWRGFREEWMYENFPVDINETEEELILNADLPGFEKDDIMIRVTENTIEIAARKKKEEKEITKTMYRRERAMGVVRRLMSLPVEVDPDNITAEFKNGVLAVRMKKKKIKKGKEIKIK